MAAVDDVEELIDRYHLGGHEFLKGNPEPLKKLWSRRDDVTLANPFGPPVRGMRLLRPRTLPHRRSEMASSLASRS
jgi:hypothetical protein